MAAKKDGEEFEHDWYGILGLEVGSPIEEVTKAARKLARDYHPDKTTDPEAPAKFLLIQKAKEVLSYEAKKKLIDEHFLSLRKREQYEAERNKTMDAQRMKFRNALDQKVQHELNRSSTVLDPNEVLSREIKKRTKIIEELRRKNQNMMEEAAEEARKKAEKKQSDFMNYSKTMAEELGTKTCQIKVKWRRSAESHSDDSLYQLFKIFGAIEDITLSATKGTSANITFSSEGAASAAVDAYATSEDYRVSLVFAEKTKQKATIFTHQYTASESFNQDLQQEIERAKMQARGFESLGSNVSSQWQQANNTSVEGQRLAHISLDSFCRKEEEVLSLLEEASKKKRRLDAEL